MDDPSSDSPPSEEKRTPPPPPDIPKPSSLPPPSALDAAKPKPPPPPAETTTSSAPPLQVSVSAGSTADDPDDAPSGAPDAPGTDASVQNRVIAAFIDGVIWAGVMAIFTMFLPNWLGWVLGCAYFVTRDSLPFLNGQSVGKKAMNLMAVTIEGKPLTGDWKTGVIRNIACGIPFFAFVELFVLINRQEGPKPLLRLGDEWGRTKVINAERNIPVAATTPPPAPVDSSKEEASEKEESNG